MKNEEKNNSISKKEKTVNMINKIENILDNMEKESVFVREYLYLLDNKEVRQYVSYLNYLHILEDELSNENNKLDNDSIGKGR